MTEAWWWVEEHALSAALLLTAVALVFVSVWLATRLSPAQGVQLHLYGQKCFYGRCQLWV